MNTSKRVFATSEIVKVEQLKKYFPVHRSFIEQMVTRKKSYVKAVDEITFSVRKGEIFTLAGESGCGKSTTGKLILRLISPTSGKIYLNGMDITRSKGEKLRTLRRQMQMIFQDPYASLSPRMKIGKAIKHPLEISGTTKGKESGKAVLEVLEKVGLTPAHKFVNLFPHQLSGGQRQRVALARSIILKPSFIIADEPVSMIDASLRTTIIDLLLSFRKELGLSYLFITHDLAVAKYISDRIAIMYLGKVIEIGSKERLFANPLHPYTQALLSSIPVPNPERKKKAVELQGDVPSAINIPEGCRFHPRCPFARFECIRKEPELVEVERDHSVSCLLYWNR